MGVDADLHADAAPRDAIDDAGEPASLEAESYEDGGGYEEESGDETDGGEDAASDPLPPEPAEDSSGFDAERAWAVFAEGVALALDCDSTDEFLARVLGAIARAGRALGNDAAHATTLLASTLGAGFSGNAAQPTTAQDRARHVFAALARWMAEGLDDLEAFDAAAALYADDGLDEALVPLAALGARLLAADLAGGARTALHRSAGRALLHASASAVRELAAAGERRHVRTLPRLARSVARVIRRGGLTARDAARRVPAALSQAARRIAASPELAIRLATPAPPARPAAPGEATPAPREHRFTFTGPVTLSISGR